MMLSKRFLGLVASVSLTFLAVLISKTEGRSPGEVSAMAWEYTSFIQSSRQAPDEALNRLGHAGWKLVTVNQDSRGDLLQFTLKRPFEGNRKPGK
jgi:hypothetical protein